MDTQNFTLFPVLFQASNHKKKLEIDIYISHYYCCTYLNQNKHLTFHYITIHLKLTIMHTYTRGKTRLVLTKRSTLEKMKSHLVHIPLNHTLTFFLTRKTHF